MTKEKRTRRLCASLALTVLASTTILTGMAPVVAHAEGETPGEATSSVLVTPSLDGAAAALDLPAAGEAEGIEAQPEVEKEADEDVEHNAPVMEIPNGEVAAESNAEPTSAAIPDVAADSLADSDDSAEEAVPRVIARGTWGTVEWVVSLEGELMLNGGTGSDSEGGSPWVEYADDIKQVAFLDTVYAPANSSSMFSGLTRVTEFVNLERLDTSNVTSMRNMFYGTNRLESSDVSNFNVSGVKAMGWMFGFSGVKSFDLSAWHFNPEVNLDRMFGGINLIEVNFGNAVFDNPQAPFEREARRSSVDKLVLGSQTRLINVPIKAGMQWEGTNLGHKFFDQYDGGYADTYTLTPAPKHGTWGTVDWLLEDDGTLLLEGGIGEDTGSRSPWWAFGSLITRIIVNGAIEAPEDSEGLFAGFSNLVEIEHLDRLDVAQVQNMRGMFEYNGSLKDLQVDNWDTSQVTSMAWMFSGCRRLAEIQVDNWDVSSVYTFYGTFQNTSSLSNLNLLDWNVASLEVMDSFLKGSGVEEVNLSTWYAKDLQAYDVFIDMPSLKYLDIGSIGFSHYYSGELINGVNQLETLVVGDDTYLNRFWAPDGQVWAGEMTGHQFGRQYNGGYSDTYHLQAGELGYVGIWFEDHTLEDNWFFPSVLYGELGAMADLSQLDLPTDYELVDPSEKIELLAVNDDNNIEYRSVGIKQIPKITTRRITFTGLPAGTLEDVVQEVKWHWNWYWPGADYRGIARDDEETLIYLPQNHFEAFTVPEVPGYKAEVTTVDAQHIDTSNPIFELANAEDVTVHFTKLSTGGGDANNGNSDNGSGTETGGSSTSTEAGVAVSENANTKDVVSTGDDTLPQTGSVAASGLAALGLGLLGLLGINWRKRRRS